MELPAELEDHWADFRRSLARRGRSPATVRVYRKSYEAFWGWATIEGTADPAAVDHRVVNRWCDHMLTEVGRPLLGGPQESGVLTGRDARPAPPILSSRGRRDGQPVRLGRRRHPLVVRDEGPQLRAYVVSGRDVDRIQSADEAGQNGGPIEDLHVYGHERQRIEQSQRRLD